MTPKALHITKDHLMRVLREQQGVLFAEPAIVWRNTYGGRGILNIGSDLTETQTDARGYAKVEWWVMSMTAAENPLPIPGEGMTKILIADELFSLDQAAALAGDVLFGAYLHRWPLTKVLDIGGATVVPDFRSVPEDPPIPPHVHAGVIENGKVRSPGKLEAYFFPPTECPPYGLRLERIQTRLGLLPGISKENFLDALEAFGQSDRMYSLLNEFPARAYDGWTIWPGVVHAPGPWPTIEMQTPQDDFNLAAWQLGQRLPEPERQNVFQSLALRGLASTEDFLDQLVDWESSTALDFRDRFYRPATSIEEGFWGRRLQIFFGEFYGEAIELRQGASWTHPPAEVPFAGLVWSGSGLLNGVPIGATASKKREFLAVPQASLTLESDSNDPLVIFTFFPLRT